LQLEADAQVRDLYYLDECGFAPTAPTGYTWARVGSRAVVPRQDKKGRRVNVLGALAAGPEADLLWEHHTGKIDAMVLMEFVCARLGGLPGGAAGLDRRPAGWRRPRPCTVVLDNASAHVDRVFKGRRDDLAVCGIELFYLPPRSPELNLIERVWRSAKYEDYPQRSHTSIDAIATAVDQALTKQRNRVQGSAPHFVKTA
jgi:transposase